MNKKELYASLLDELVYEPTTGDFYWSTPKVGRSKGLAGTLNHSGYLVITYKGYKISGSIFAWYFMTGEFPNDLIGYIDGNNTNLKWENLKLVSRQEVLINYREQKEKLEVKRLTPGSPFRASFDNNDVNHAVEQFLEGKVLVDGRYQPDKAVTQ